jgi:putative transposase
MPPVPEGRSTHPPPIAVYDSAMSHTYCSSLFHCVFSTKERRKTITLDIQPRLWAYIGGIAREHDMKALAVGGIDDHVHILLSLPSSQPIAKAMREIKSASSHWMHEACAMTSFEWQEGYGAFSIGSSQAATTLAYITRQEEHHRKRDFQAEFVAFLKKHSINYDPRYVWG